MSFDGFQVNTEARTDRGEFTPIPKNFYRCAIEEVTNGQTKSKHYNMLTVKLKIMEGEFKNRVVYDYMCYQALPVSDPSVDRERQQQVAQAGADQVSLLAIALGHQGQLSNQIVAQFVDKIVDAKIETITKKGKNGKPDDTSTQVWSYRHAASPAEQAAALYGNSAQSPQPQRSSFPDDDIPFG
jgi:hypothetical protein